MLINAPIGQDSNDPYAAYVDGAIFQKELMEIDGMGKKRICIHINCVGGNVMEGYNICSAILKSKTPVDTYNVGIAASMAGAIFMCGRKRVMMDYAVLMIHNPFGGTDKKQLDAMRGSLVTMISAKCNLDDKQVAYLMDRESWIGASECLSQGFCTEIEATSKSNQKMMPLAQAGIRAMWAGANEIYNNIQNSNTMDAKATGLGLIANYLDLNVDASENSVFSEVKTRINKAVMAKEEADDSLAKIKKEMDVMKAGYEELKKKYDSVEAELATTKAEAKVKIDAEIKKAADEKAAIETENKKIAVKAMVQPFAGNRIKTEEVDSWIETGLTLGLEKTKALIEKLPLNAPASTIQVGGTPVQNAANGGNVAVDPNQTPASTMHYSAKVMAETKARNKASIGKI